jgi:hypothetical protein
MPEIGDYVILEWIPDVPEFPRYSVATVKHAEELGSQVHWLQRCPSLQMAAERARQLTLAEASKRTTIEEESSVLRPRCD